MTLKDDSFACIAQRLRSAADAFLSVSDVADVATVATPDGVRSRSTDGVRRPVEDLVIARDEAGVYTALRRTRHHAEQAVLHAEAAHRHAQRTARVLDRD
ncbi:hypothetical protein ATK36_3169 [Amycolatopsis sulphurea]|uniref:Uncharacterized protein n=1 Tax=Amycolatopsis sulphurea TaxID=76022 RepID=A0A2A9FCE8_9PSEU|nr:hypothetical protein [Amycolatopsis sulphurea]PFG48095.1 hypothetical protein ATK36_3169 [Amycolatopsis sulphurea]